jgi:hypothetical protein
MSPLIVINLSGSMLEQVLLRPGHCAIGPTSPIRRIPNATQARGNFDG